ncbi:MAG: radical SAM protein [Actinobacteria bacterium]|nr:radical SAM protein [Actinomycetota bacterium]
MSKYVDLYEKGLLKEKAQEALQHLEACDLCPRQCRVDRTTVNEGICRTGREAKITSYGPHFGEERPLVGRKGSGTIFFTSCNMRCIFCQNYEISQLREGYHISADKLADIMLSLQSSGCHNINFVSPSHFVAQIMEALVIATGRGLSVPLVYNTGGYDSIDALNLLDGIVDIYMPDIKYMDASVGKRLSGVKNYPQVVKDAIREMHRQVGDLVVDERGVAVRGLLVRHLVLPEQLAGTEEAMRFLADEISKNTYINIMDQYYPCYKALDSPPLNRRVNRAEFEAAVGAAKEAGLTRLDHLVSRSSSPNMDSFWLSLF